MWKVKLHLNRNKGLPWWLSGKDSACSAGDAAGAVDSIPGLRRSPGEGNGNPLIILAWKIPWIEEPGSMGLQRVRHDLVTKQEQTEYFRTRNISKISLNKILKWKIYYFGYIKGFPGSSENKESAAMQETQVQSLGWEDPLEKRMACLKNSMDRRVWWVIVHGVSKSQLR